MSRTGVAIIGCGMAAKPHAEALAALADTVEVRGVYTRTPERAEAFGEHPVPRTGGPEFHRIVGSDQQVGFVPVGLPDRPFQVYLEIRFGARFHRSDEALGGDPHCSISVSIVWAAEREPTWSFAAAISTLGRDIVRSSRLGRAGCGRDDRRTRRWNEAFGYLTQT